MNLFARKPGDRPIGRRMAGLTLALFAVLSPPVARGEENDFPTEARADYVFGCMAANGQTQLDLRHCACSLDVVASILPYDRYVAAETVLSMRQGVGRTASVFRGVAKFDDMVAELRRAQAEAEIRCFN